MDHILIKHADNINYDITINCNSRIVLVFNKINDLHCII